MSEMNTPKDSRTLLGEKLDGILTSNPKDLCAAALKAALPRLPAEKAERILTRLNSAIFGDKRDSAAAMELAASFHPSDLDSQPRVSGLPSRRTITPPPTSRPNRGQQIEAEIQGVLNSADDFVRRLSQHYSDFNVIVVPAHNSSSDAVTKQLTTKYRDKIIETLQRETASAQDKEEAVALVSSFFEQIGEKGSIADQQGFYLGDKHFELVGLCMDQVRGYDAMYGNGEIDKLATVLHEVGHLIHFRYFNGEKCTPQQQEVFADAFAAHVMRTEYGISDSINIIARKRESDNDPEYPFHLFAETVEHLSSNNNTFESLDRFNETVIRKILNHSAFSMVADSMRGSES
jgi:hypothetical protein